MRPEILFPLFAPVTSLKGVGSRVAPLLEKLAGPIVRDVAFLRPHSVIRRERSSVAAAMEGAVQVFEVRIDAYKRPRAPQQPWRIETHDETGLLSLVFFGRFGGDLETKHPVGSRRLVSGKVERFGLNLQIAHPDYLLAPERAAEIPAFEAV